MQKMLTEVPVEPLKLMEGPVDSSKVDKSWQKDPRPLRKLTESNGRSHDRTEC